MILTDCPDEPMPAITAREVFQVLHDAIFGRRMMVKAPGDDGEYVKNQYVIKGDIVREIPA
ncbi:hypothetical protein [Pseudomonas saxonica]|nr:hypothetical protein [Pseudomonas saxonica]